MVSHTKTMEAIWSGPYSWPFYESENHLNPLPKMSGVYLQTFRYRNGYLIYAAGLTRRSVLMRFKEHTKGYVNGNYTVLDIEAAQQGMRKEVWHGWGYARSHREEFEYRKEEIIRAY